MKIKVCGLKHPENIREVIQSRPDLVGYIFYKKSPRYIGNDPDRTIFSMVPKNIKKVGVFVNESLDVITAKYRRYELDMIQLHGDEKFDYCRKLHKQNIPVIIAFHVDEDFDFNELIKYEMYCDFFLFDTKGKSYGGNGTKFNWELLRNYNLNTPFFLSGGISPEDTDHIIGLDQKIFGVDINSRFEISPGIKNTSLVKTFIHELRSLNVCA